MSRLQLSGGEGAGREVSRNPPADGPVSYTQLTARVEAESALDQLGRAKVAMLCAAFFALVGGVVVLVHAGGDATMLAVGIFMAALACVYAALAFLVRKAPLTLSIAGFLLSWLCLGGFPGLVIVGAMALSLWFAVQYVRITNRVGLLERKIAELKKCTEHSI